MRQSHSIVLATNNRDKFLEFQTLLMGYKNLIGEVELLPAGEVIRNSDKLASLEVHDDYVEHARAKARFANMACHYPCLGDDSGLEVKALKGEPGVRSARFAIPKAGQSQSDANIQKLLEQLKGKTGAERTARFVCALTLSMEGVHLDAWGVLEGTIAEKPSGTKGFGYDPIFIPQGANRTLAQFSEAEKNEISHRAHALRNLMQQIRDRGVVLGRP